MNIAAPRIIYKRDTGGSLAAQNAYWAATRKPYKPGDPIGFGKTMELAKLDLFEAEHDRGIIYDV